MTTLEHTIRELERLRESALREDEAARLRFANMALGCWPTILDALRLYVASKIRDKEPTE